MVGFKIAKLQGCKVVRLYGCRSVCPKVLFTDISRKIGNPLVAYPIQEMLAHLKIVDEIAPQVETGGLVGNQMVPIIIEPLISPASH